MTTKYTILNKVEIADIKQWLANRYMSEVAKELGCSKRSLQNYINYDSNVSGWKFPTERLEKLKTLMNG